MQDCCFCSESTQPQKWSVTLSCIERCHMLQFNTLTSLITWQHCHTTWHCCCTSLLGQHVGGSDCHPWPISGHQGNLWMKSCGTAASPGLTSEENTVSFFPEYDQTFGPPARPTASFQSLKKLNFFSPLPPDSLPEFVCSAMGVTEWLLTHAAAKYNSKFTKKKTGGDAFSIHFNDVFQHFAWSWFNRIILPVKRFFLSYFHLLPVGNSFWKRSAQLRLNWAMGRKEGERAEHGNYVDTFFHFLHTLEPIVSPSC